MADFRAISAVTGTMRALLEDRLEDLGVPIVVSCGTPRPDPPPGGVLAAESARVNLFLFRVVQHPTLPNDDELPGASPGAYGTPPLSLTLHYLVTGFGSAVINLPDGTDVTDERQAQEVLGNAMRVLHDVTTVSRRTVRQRPPIGADILNPILRDDIECLKIAPLPLSLEELSKVWTALAIRFRLSTAYEVSCVRIESRRPRLRPGLVGEPPAAGPRVTVYTLASLQIRRIAVQRPPDPVEHEQAYTRIADVLVLHGEGFRAGQQVSIGGLLVDPALVTPSRLEVVVPDQVLPNGTPIPPAQWLQPGALEVFLRSPVGGTWAGYARSNARPAVLVPRVANAIAAGRTVQVAGTRLVDPTLGGEAIIGASVVASARFLVVGPLAITIPLSDGFPAANVPCLVSAQHAAVPHLPAAPVLQVTCGGVPGDAPLQAAPPDLATLAADIELGLHNAGANPAALDPGLQGAKVGVATNRFVLFSGGLTAMPVVTASATAAALALNPGVNWTGYLSGALDAFPAITAALPQLRVTFGAIVRDIALPGPPATLAEAALFLENALHAGGPPPAFAQSSVAVVGIQLLVVPGTFAGAPPAVDIAEVPGLDLTTVRELRFRIAAPVRVRVNGVESIDAVTVALP